MPSHTEPEKAKKKAVAGGGMNVPPQDALPIVKVEERVPDQGRPVPHLTS